MPWTKITRAQYLRNGLRYASDMTDAGWRLIARKLPARRRLGRPRKVDLRKVVEAVLFILSTCCQWRALPREFPPYSTVQGYLCLARHSPLAQDRQGSCPTGEAQARPQADTDGSHHRQPECSDNTSRRPTRL